MFVRARAMFERGAVAAASIEIGAPSFVAAGHEIGVVYGLNLRRCGGCSPLVVAGCGCGYNGMFR
jgi:hypothetical protein